MNPRKPALARPLALRLAATEYDRCTAVFSALEPGHWTAQTDCPAWDVRQMAAHMLGMAEMAASMRENLRQQRLARRIVGRDGGLYIDALTQLQVDERAGWAPHRITGRYRARAPKAVTGRRRAPSFVRHRAMPQLNDVNGTQEPWTFGYLIGVIVADLVAEWSDRHGKDFVLILTGPAGGTWSAGENGPAMTLDAIDFCRAVARRPSSVTLGELMNTEVPF